MSRIRILDEHIANQIAAGEVVERPSSVVKELVENSIDAGSSQIDIWIEEGGLRLIRVLDNGCGMEPEDCEKAFFRHATSKIASSKDLFQIRSLGFRGEALPSIAAVSKLTCTTSAEPTGLGRTIVMEGGTITSIEETSATQGTDIQVRDLFYNTPARLKYMKTIQTEIGHISDFVYRLSLAHPQISFTLHHNGHLMIRTLGNHDLLQVIAAIYGTSIAKQMVKVQGESVDYKLSGYICRPEITRANRQGITVIVNGRYIRNHMLTKAIINAYHTMLPIHRYPIAVLHIEMDPTLMDVNVHPSKLEVRFSKEIELLDFIESQLKSVLKGQVFIPNVTKPESSKKAIIQEQITDPGMDTVQVRPDVRPMSNASNKAFVTRTEANQIRETITAFAPHVAEEPKKPAFPKLYPIGQMRGTYIIAQNEEGLYLIDQHAAHERIHYEYYYRRFGEPDSASQELLLPITLEFTPSESAILKERLHLLEQVGVMIEHFGGNTFNVRSHPHWFPKGEEKEIIEEMVEWVVHQNTSIDLAKLREQSAIMCSCKASIKANEHLSLEEIEALLERLAQCHHPYSCPHGRPIIVSFSNYELEKMFKRA